MSSNNLKIIIKIIAYDLVFLVLLRLALITIPHEEQDLIYYVNLNLQFIIACAAWMNLGKSNVNKPLVILLAIWYTPNIFYIPLYIFSGTLFSENAAWINYHIAYIYITSYQLLVTFYIFILSLYPYKTNKVYLRWSVLLTIIIAGTIYAPIFISGNYLYGLEHLFQKSYYLHLLNFSLLVVFWHQYTQTKLIFSEYLSSILSVYTVMVGLDILHSFSFENDLLFLYFAQYFNLILYLIIAILWVIRLNYLSTTASKENEDYIQNYYLLQGFVDKPRKGLLVNFYSGLNKTMVITAVLIICFLGVYLFSYDKFEIFIKLNILLLILAIIISAILAIVTWHKRWYDAMGFFFKKQKLDKVGK